MARDGVDRVGVDPQGCGQAREFAFLAFQADAMFTDQPGVT